MTEDKALLWARERYASIYDRCKGGGIDWASKAKAVRSGDCDEQFDELVLGFRAGQAEAEARVSYQARVGAWLTDTFAADVCKDTLERAMRFLEEATELCQALGMTPEQAATVSAYVFGRPVGEPSQEVGGVMVTLASLCHSTGMDMAQAGETELARINTPEMRAKIAAKQVSKRLFGMTADTARAALESHPHD